MGIFSPVGGSSVVLVISLISALAAVVSLVIAVSAIVVSIREAHAGRVSANTWEMYRGYNSDSVRLGRDTARQVLRDWPAGFVDLKAYQAYFAAPLPAGYPLPPGITPERMQKQREQSMHDLMAYYHQVGLLLGKGELDKDFTLLLVGGGLVDRWQSLANLPAFYPESDGVPYGGMYLLHQTFRRWARTRRRRLDSRFRSARDRVTREVAQEQAALATSSK